MGLSRLRTNRQLHRCGMNSPTHRKTARTKSCTCFRVMFTSQFRAYGTILITPPFSSEIRWYCRIFTIEKRWKWGKLFDVVDIKRRDYVSLLLPILFTLSFAFQYNEIVGYIYNLSSVSVSYSFYKFSKSVFSHLFTFHFTYVGISRQVVENKIFI